MNNCAGCWNAAPARTRPGGSTVARHEDPPVYCFGDIEGDSYRKAYDSIWDFIASMVTYDEVMRKKNLS